MSFWANLSGGILRRIHDLKEQKGMTLIQLLVATGIASFLILAMGSLLLAMTRHQESLKLAAVRDDLHSHIREVLFDEESIEYTRTQEINLLFAQCFNAKHFVGDCTGQSIHPLWLYSAQGNLVAGPPSDPVYYDANGGRCASASPRCFIQVTTTIRPQALPNFGDHFLEEIPIWEKSFDFIEIKYSISFVNNNGKNNLRAITGSHTLDLMDWYPVAP